ncbi:hypothetical protein BDN67DRAFT_1016078 [Paxillus ammoniavirescens]|nr:hypothetical protein BDN67DRAFT_1016078 [Paxillus ammoniavirescens]
MFFPSKSLQMPQYDHDFGYPQGQVNQSLHEFNSGTALPHLPPAQTLSTNSDSPRLPPSSPSPLSDVVIQPAVVRPPTEPGLINISQTAITAGTATDVSMDQGRCKCKPIPSQRAQRDNTIGELGRENHIPMPAKNVKKPRKKTKKRMASSEPEEPPKKSKKAKVASGVKKA